LVGGAINSLKPNIKLQSSPMGDRYPTLMIYGGLYRDNRGDTSLVPIFILVSILSKYIYFASYQHKKQFWTQYQD
jgi:hypothetical protein